MKNLTLRLPDELHEALSASADDRGKSLNGLICELLARGMTEYGLRRSLVETVRQEMRAEFEARMPFDAAELDWMKRQAAAGVSHQAYMHAACSAQMQSSVKRA